MNIVRGKVPNTLVGDQEAIGYAKRDLEVVDKVLQTVKRRRICLQAGGNQGVFPLYLSSFFEAVYTFEPDRENFDYLTVNTHRCENVFKFQAALGCVIGDRVALSKIRRDGRKNNHAGIVHVTGAGNVPVVTIDSLGINELDLLYLDLEGYEYDAIVGAQQTLDRCSPVVVLEVNHQSAFYGIPPQVIRDQMDKFGYRMIERLGSDEVFIK